jgi:hypothetical protein
VTVRGSYLQPKIIGSRNKPYKPSEDSSLFLATISIFVKNLKQRLRRYFLYISTALLLLLDDPYIEDKI